MVGLSLGQGYRSPGLGDSKYMGQARVSAMRLMNDSQGTVAITIADDLSNLGTVRVESRVTRTENHVESRGTKEK